MYAQIEYKGITYYWEDFCSNTGGFPYEFPCGRLSPMDFFQEAKWFMGVDLTTSDAYNNETVPAPRQDLYRRTWYKDLIQERLIQPRIPRFDILTRLCAGSQHCENLLGFRLNPFSPGYSPFSLFADIGNMVRISINNLIVWFACSNVVCDRNGETANFYRSSYILLLLLRFVW